MSPPRLSTAAIALGLLLALSPLAQAKDQDRAREAVRRGEAVPLEQVTAHALKRFGGRVIEVEIDGERRRIEYEIELLLDDGRVIELTYQGRDGSLIEIKGQRLETLFERARP